MFEKIAKFRLPRARRMAPEPRQIVPANDNQRGAGRSGRHRPSLVCRWTFDQGPSCHWEIEGGRGPNPLLADEPPADEPIHITVSVPSYDKPDAKRRQARGCSLVSIAPNLLHAHH
jgi:hypothetical protein